MKPPRFAQLFLGLFLAILAQLPLNGSAESVTLETPREAVGKIYSDIVRLQGEDFYRHVDLESLADGFLGDVEPLILASRDQAAKELSTDAPVLAKVLAGGNISAAKAAAKSMFLLDTERWFNISATGKLVSAFAGDAGVILAQYREFAKRQFLEYRGVKYVRVQGDTAVVAVSIHLKHYNAEIQPVGQFKRDKKIWRLTKILNVNALVQRVQTLEKARIAYFVRQAERSPGH